MADPDLEVEVDNSAGDSGASKHRGRGVFAAVLLLLLALCGVTTITQTYVNSGNEQVIRSITQNLQCLQCHTELLPDFSRDWVHNPFESKSCTTCHTPHGTIEKTTVISAAKQTWNRVTTLVEWLPLKILLDVFDAGSISTGAEVGGKAVTTEKKIKGEKSELVLPVNELCWMCHGDMGWQRNAAYPHAPFTNGNCLDCHSPHASDHRAMLQVDVEDLCVRCHPMGQQLNRAQAHAPVAGFHCTDCHDPHGSQVKGILVATQRELCFRCHPSVARLSGMGVQHAPFQYDACTDCHEAHGSDYTPLLRNSQPELCYECHPGVATDFLKVSHHPVGTISLNCGDCHDPHATNYSGLLHNTGNGICYDCHASTVKTSYDASAHFKTPCWGCHTPHGSNYGSLLRDSQPEVCFQCHSRLKYDDRAGGAANHPVRSVYWDINKNAPLTCTSSCHNPHGSPHSRMLRAYDAPLDGNCIICHARVPSVMVGVDY